MGLFKESINQYYDEFRRIYFELRESNDECDSMDKEYNDNAIDKYLNLSKTIFRWIEENLDYFYINDFVRDNDDYYTALIDIYIKKKKKNYDYLPNNISDFNDNQVTKEYNEILSITKENKKLNNYDKSKKDNKKLYDEYIEFSNLIKEKCGIEALNKATDKLKKEWDKYKKGV